MGIISEILYISVCVCSCSFLCYIPQSGRRGRDRVVVGLTAYAINPYHHSVVRSNSSNGDVYSVQHYVIKFVSKL